MTNLETLDLTDAISVKNLRTIILVDCDNLEYLDGGMTKVKSLTLKNCVNLSVCSVNPEISRP